MTELRVHIEDRGRVRILTIDDGRLNGLSPEMRDLISTAMAAARRDAAVEAIVLTGAGGNFSAGGDVGSMLAQQHADRVDRLERFQLELLAWSRDPRPVLTAVEGAAAGGGVAMIAASDWAVAGSDARFVAGWPAIGLAPDLGACWWLVRTLGAKRAYDWLLTGAPLPADEAQRLGLLSRVTEPGRALETAVAAAERILRIPAPSRASTKALLRTALAMPDRDAFRELERDALAALFETAEHRAAVQAFLDRSARP
jgi:2-(1,2-epoxy-1,2-dihydrophenyl)acetyl-CoA isomerase